MKVYLDDSKFFWFVCTHLGHQEQEIPTQLNQLLNHLASIKEDVVLVGDFNFSKETGSSKLLHQIFANHGFKDCGPNDQISVTLPSKKLK